jgi:hypothetical protein
VPSEQLDWAKYPVRDDLSRLVHFNPAGVLATERLFAGAPFEMRLSGVSNFVVEGSTVLVQCQVLAKFKLDISWYNDTDLIPTGFENSDGVNVSTFKKIVGKSFANTSRTMAF